MIVKGRVGTELEKSPSGRVSESKGGSKKKGGEDEVE